MNHSTPGLCVHPQLPEFTQIHVHWVGDAIQPYYPLLSPSPPALNLSQHQGLFKWVSSSHQVAKYCSFSFNISPSNEHPGLISFRMDRLDLPAVQGTLKELGMTERLNWTDSDWHVLILHCSFGLHFSNNEWSWASFHVFISHLKISFGEISV